MNLGCIIRLNFASFQSVRLLISTLVPRDAERNTQGVVASYVRKCTWCEISDYIILISVLGSAILHNRNMHISLAPYPFSISAIRN